MSAAHIILIASTVFFLVYARLCVMETSRGKRLFIPGVRRALDNGIDAGAAALRRKLVYVSRYMITLSWYYSLHTFLRLTLQFIAGVYTMIETVLHRNRDKARQIRRERRAALRSHLTVLAEHKVDTELTPHQKAKRKAKALSGK